MRLLLLSPAEQTPITAVLTNPFQASLLRIQGRNSFLLTHLQLPVPTVELLGEGLDNNYLLIR